MIRINQKQKQLLELLLNQYDVKPISYYADVLHVSSRSIHNYLKHIATYVEPMQLRVHTKQGVGIQIVGGTKERMLVLNMLYRQKEEIEEYTTKRRQQEIARMLFIEEQTVTHQKLAAMFYVSTTSIAKDLQTIASFLDGSTVQLEATKKGTKSKGSELQKQTTMVAYMLFLLQDKAMDTEELLSTKGKAFLAAYFDMDIMACIEQAMTHIKTVYPIAIPEKYRLSLWMVLLVFFTRLQQHKHPRMDRNFIFEEIHHLETYFIAEELVKQSAKRLLVAYQESDVDYINKQLIAHGMVVSYEATKTTNPYAQYVSQLIAIMSDVLEVNLCNDENLYNSVMLHFAPMMYRLQMQIPMKNPLVNEIREQYSIVFSGVWYAMSTIETLLDVHLTDDEISFLAVHFQIAIERNKHGKKIVIVCPHGMGMSELIYQKIKKILPAQDTLEVIASKHISKRDLRQVDFIITAVDVTISSIPVLKVSSLISNTDIKNITNMYTQLFYENEQESVDETYIFTTITHLIDSHYIFPMMDFTTREECLTFITDRLLADGVVDEGFQESVFLREHQGETDLVSGVALPHASPEYVKHSRLVIVTLANAMVWQTQKVDTVLLLCLSKADIHQVKAMLSEVYMVVSSRERVHYYFKNKTKEEMLQFFKPKKR